MTIPRTIATLTLVVASLTGVHAASFVVSPGQSIQEAINAASAGDNITVQTGNYNENLTINKGLDIRGAGGAVLVTGTLAISSVTTPVYIADISFGKSGASGMTVTGSSNVRFDRIKLVGGGNLGATNSTVYCYKGQFDASVSFTGSTWTLQRSTIAGNLTSGTSTAKCIATTVTGNFSHNNGELTIFQSDLRESTDVALTSAQKSWICYNTLRYLQINNGTSQVVGNRFDGRDRNDFFIYLFGGCVVTVRNNMIFNDGMSVYAGSGGGATAIRIAGTAGQVRLFNNVMHDVMRGIEVVGSPAGVEVRGNMHTGIPGSYYGGQYSLSTTAAGTIVDGNNFQSGINGGTQTSNKNVDPQYVTTDSVNVNFLKLGASSPCLNAGPSDAIFNDIDGSRNDQGAYGGHSYDPEGRTTLKPVVLSGEVAPLYIKRGGAVTVKAHAAVAAAP